MVSKQGRDARSIEARYEIQKSLTLMNEHADIQDSS